MKERISKILSMHGVCSRRAAEKLIEEGRVRLNGAVVSLGEKADPALDRIEVDGELLKTKAEHVYVLLNKPRGYVTTASDEKGRRTVLDLVRDVPARIWPVGRLDMDSEGLLLLTNDGDLTNQLTHPRHEVSKTYQVRVSGDADAAVLKLRGMTKLDGETIQKPSVRILKKDGERAVLSIVIHEGKNRQVRRMCAAADLRVFRLKRVQEGNVRLGDLPTGQWRYLTEEELAQLKQK